MGWRHLRRTLGALGLLLAVLVAFWPQLAHNNAHADQAVNVNPTSGPPGTTVTVTVTPPTGYTANDPIELLYLPGYPELCDVDTPLSFTVQQDGSLPSMTLSVPPSTSCPSNYGAQISVLVGGNYIGSTTFQVTNNAGGATLTPTVTGTPPTSTPTIIGQPTATGTAPTTNQFVLNPSTAALNQPIGFTAGGFTPNEQISLSILLNNQNVPLTTSSGSLIADGTGRVSGTFILPVSSQTILATNVNGNAGYTALVTVVGANTLSKQQATLTVPPTAVNAGANAIIPGTTITITGGGFASGETVSLALINTSNNNSTTALGSTTARVDGTISTSVTAPNANGVFTLKATGQTSTMVAVQQVTIGTPIGITVSPVIATVGQNVNVTGFGFTHNASVTINGLDGGPIGVTADNNGAFTIGIAAPNSPPGSVITVRATDTNGLSANTFLSFDNGQSATVSVTPTTVSPGQILTVSGSNYAAGETVSVELASNAAPPVPITSTVKLVTIDATRAFTTTLTIPNLTNGLYLLVATGQTTNRTAVTSLNVQNGLATPTATATTNPGYVAFPTPNVPNILPTATPTIPPQGMLMTYFAEGFTGLAKTNGRATFSESLNLFNTKTTPASATVTYYVLGANNAITKITKTITLGSLAASTLSVNSDVGNDKQVSIAVAHSPGVVAQMALTRTDPKGAPLDAAASSGSNQAAATWNFAEGYTGGEFQEYLSIFNPNAAAASVQVHFLPTSGAPPAPATYTVGPNGRLSINVRSVYLGLAGQHAPKSVAIIVTGNQKIVVDRVLYWGTGGGSGKFGYEIAPGIPSGSTATAIPGLVLGSGNEPYITILNPGTTRSGLQVIFRDPTGRTLASYTSGIAGQSRLTVAVRNLLHTFGGVVSATVTSSAPLVAEAPLYLGGSPNVGTHPGVTELGTNGSATVAVAGYSAAGASLYVFNPNGIAIQVTRQTGGAAGPGASTSFTVPPLGLAISTLPPAAGPHGLVLTANRPFAAAVINGSAATQAVWGGTLIAP